MATTQIRPTYASPANFTLNSSCVDTNNSTVVCTTLGGISFLSGQIKITSNLAYNTQIATSIPKSLANNVWVLLVGHTTHNMYLTRITSQNVWMAVDAMTKATEDTYDIISTAYQRDV